MYPTKRLLFFSFFILLLGCQPQNSETTQPTPSANYKMDRTVLPIQGPTLEPITEMDARNATAPKRFEVKPPEGAPNVVIVFD